MINKPLLASKNANPFLLPGYWYRGNSHCHTTASDGQREPRDAAQWYYEHRYDFLCLTDHNKVTMIDDLAEDGILIIPGIELDAADPLIGTYHLVGLGVQSYAEPYQPDLPLQEAIDRVRSLSGLPILAHPSWMGLRSTELKGIQGLTALEVFNTTCELYNGKGSSDAFWDELLERGTWLWGIAADDTHWKQQRDDPGGGWIMVKASQCTTESILAAISQGHFWSSTGPELHKVWVENKTVYVECSPVRVINFKSQGRHGHTERTQPGNLITSACFELRGPESYIRIEIIDDLGRRAWSNPFSMTEDHPI